MKKFLLILLIPFVLFLNEGFAQPMGRGGPIGGGGAGTPGADVTLHYVTTQSEALLTAETVFSAYGVSLGTAASYAAMRTLLDLEVGIDFYSIAGANTLFDARCLEAILGTSIGPSLLLDGAVLKASAILQEYHAVDPTAFGLTILDDADEAAVRTTIGAEVDLSNEAGLYAVLSDVTQFYEAGDETAIFNAATITDITGQTVWSTYHTDGSGDFTATTVGAANTFWGGNGVTAAPTWQLLTDADIPSSIDPDKIGTDGSSNNKIEAANLNIVSVDLALTTESIWTGQSSVAGELAVAASRIVGRASAGSVDDLTPAQALGVVKDGDADIWQCVSISVAAMIADETNCTAPDSEAVNSGPNVWFSTCSDAAGTLESGIPMPENWDGGNIYVEMLAGTLEGSPAGTVEFEVSTQACSNDELVDNTWVTGDNVQFAANIDTQYDLVIAESDVIAAAGAGGDMLYMKLTRDNDDGTNDTSTQDVEVWGVRVYYQIDDLDERD